MSARYPQPAPRKRVVPGSVPLRSWGAKSYSPQNGFAASGLDGSSIHGEPSVQMPDGGFHAIDARRTQNPTPVRLRKFG
jgi:hypothetical protein